MAEKNSHLWDYIPDKGGWICRQCKQKLTKKNETAPCNAAHKASKDVANSNKHQIYYVPDYKEWHCGNCNITAETTGIFHATVCAGDRVNDADSKAADKKPTRNHIWIYRANENGAGWQCSMCEVPKSDKTYLTDCSGIAAKGNKKMSTYNGNSSYGNGSGWSGSYKSKCVEHLGNPVLDYHGMLVSGWKKSDLPASMKKTLIINLTGTSVGEASWPLKSLPPALDLLNKREEYGISLGDELLIDWPDRNAVAIRAKWWAEALKEIKAAGYEAVNVCCFGGHGRTGTALACMLVAAKAVKSGDAAVDLVRKLHCPECIESNSQLNYIDYVCAYYGVTKTKSAVAA